MLRPTESDGIRVCLRSLCLGPPRGHFIPNSPSFTLPGRNSPRHFSWQGEAAVRPDEGRGSRECSDPLRPCRDECGPSVADNRSLPSADAGLPPASGQAIDGSEEDGHPGSPAGVDVLMNLRNGQHFGQGHVIPDSHVCECLQVEFARDCPHPPCQTPQLIDTIEPPNTPTRQWLTKPSNAAD
jgi:hypothetical protein